MAKTRRLFLLLCICLPLLSGCTGRNQAASPVTRTGFFFDTFIQISLYDSDDEALLDECMALASRYENLFSATKEGTDIRNINLAAGAPVTVDEETIRLLEIAVSYSERTGGVFDVTIGAVSSLWDFSEDTDGNPPDGEALREALTHVGYQNILIEGNTVRLKDPEAQLDLGAIAKGYIADRFKEFLLSRGIRSALINLGGNVLAVGEKPDGAPFQIGIQTPFDTRNEALRVTAISDCSAVSSGNYERYFEKDGVLYHHILDPATGYPAENGLLGITVRAAGSVDADALSTACFLMGAEEGLRLIENTEGAEALFITGTPGEIAHYEVITSSGW